MAGSSLIGALHVKLGLDSAQFEAGTKRARAVAKRDVGEIQKIMGGVKSAFAGLATAATVAAFAGAAKRALDYAGGLGELAQQAGISSKALQEYAAIGVEVGLANSDIVSSFARLSKTIGEAQDGDKKAAETFRQLGIDVKGLTAEDAMPKLIAAFERIKSPTDQARVAADLFGRTAGAKLLPLLNMTADGFEKARIEAHELGLVLSEDAIKSADAASDALAKLKKVVEVNFAAAMAIGADGTAAFAAELARMVARIPGQIVSLQKLAVAAASAMRFAGPFGEMAARNAQYAATYLQTDKQFKQTLINTRNRLKENPKDEEARKFGIFLRQQAADRVAARKAPSSKAETEGGFEPRTDRSGGGGKKKGGGERDRTAEYLERFNREMESLKDEQLQLEIHQTRSLDQRAQLEARRILNEQEAYLFEIKSRYNKKELTEKQTEELELAVKQIAADKQTIMWNEINARKLEEQQRLADASFDIREDALRLELDSARTQEDRRRIELELLSIEFERKEAALAHLKSLYELGEATMAEVDEAENRLNAAKDARPAQEAAIARRTMTPMERYFDELPKSAKELNEAYQNVAADGLRSLNDGIVDAIMNAKSLGDVFKSVSNQIIADLLRIAVQKSITAPLANMLFGGSEGGGGGGGGLFGSLGKLFGGAGFVEVAPKIGVGGGLGAGTIYGGGLFSGLFDTGDTGLPGLAKGGSFMVGGNPGVDRNMLAINGINKVRVSSGERVTVDKAGSGPVIQLNVSEAPGFASTVQVAATGAAVKVNTNTMQRAARQGRQRLA